MILVFIMVIELVSFCVGKPFILPLLNYLESCNLIARIIISLILFNSIIDMNK